MCARKEEPLQRAMWDKSVTRAALGEREKKKLTNFGVIGGKSLFFFEYLSKEMKEISIVNLQKKRYTHILYCMRSVNLPFLQFLDIKTLIFQSLKVTPMARFHFISTPAYVYDYTYALYFNELLFLA
ncbi:hypothetical protein KP509_19G043500 [Ceratopteris richardii]|uniref:Uncharacterized protein n=1 Tax=Ceratopteris richardii TaxID=49495 RepID=A0A8T2SLX1_CERRI|nr:hypothetical protein KP509_19G043500 [Ceratopteris richardii]